MATVDVVKNKGTNNFHQCHEIERKKLVKSFIILKNLNKCPNEVPKVGQFINVLLYWRPAHSHRVTSRQGHPC